MRIKATIDHDVIRRWAAARGGRPARARILSSAGSEDLRSGMLRLDFWGNYGFLESITWESFFLIFDYNRSAFLYQERTNGAVSRFYSIIPRMPDKDHPRPVRDALIKANRRLDENAEWINVIAEELELDAHERG